MGSLPKWRSSGCDRAEGHSPPHCCIFYLVRLFSTHGAAPLSLSPRVLSRFDMEGGRIPFLAPDALKSIDDPVHCLSRLVCGQNLKIPPHVLEFQNRMRARQQVRDREELARRLSRAASERSMLQARVAELDKGKRSIEQVFLTDSPVSDSDSGSGSPPKCGSSFEWCGPRRASCGEQAGMSQSCMTKVCADVPMSSYEVKVDKQDAYTS